MDNNINEPRQHTRPKERPKHLALRNTLNIIFMVGAVVGCFIYMKDDYELAGGIIIICAIAFKIAESIIRFIK